MTIHFEVVRMQVESEIPEIQMIRAEPGCCFDNYMA